MAGISTKRSSLSLKVNLLIVSVIILVTLGLISISYRVYSKRITEYFLAQTELAAKAGKEELIPEMVRHFWNEINTEDFRKVREEALTAQDETLIRDWMLSRPSVRNTLENSTLQIDFDSFEDLFDKNLDTADNNLFFDYQIMLSALQETETLFSISEAYIQYDENGVTYNIADPNENLLYVGTIEEPIDIFANHNRNNYFPPTIYRSVFGWLCTTLLPLDAAGDGLVPGYIGIDTDMNQIVQQQRAFLLNSALYVLVLTVAAILISMLLLHRTTVQPLQQLSEAAAGFAKDTDLTSESVIDLPIRSHDEIGDLYQQIRSMQARIISHSNDLTRITAERERVRTELNMAENIQRAMLHEIFPAFPNRSEFDLFASMTPAREVGGDFYDFLMPDEKHLILLIADVSDKGVGAALFMMASKILINYRARHGGTPAEILTDVNAQLALNNDSKMFVTVWMGLLDLTTGVMTCANAGHEYPFIRSADGTFHMFKDKHGLVVGALSKTKYKDYELKLEPGDAVFVYTDGVPEANNANEELYGTKRLDAALNQAPLGDPQSILHHVKADVDAFVNGAKQFDDLTMLCVEFKQPFSAADEDPLESHVTED